MKAYRVRLPADADEMPSERVRVPPANGRTTTTFKKPKRGKPIELRRGLPVCMRWDADHRGTIVTVGAEVSEMHLDGQPRNETRFYPNEQFRHWTKD